MFFYITQGIHNLKKIHQNCMVTIGNFDGVHVGHQKILTCLKEKAIELNLPAVVIIFEPQPEEFFNKNNAPARLMRLREKIISFQTQNVKHVLVLKFNEKLAQFTAEQFIQNVLIDQLQTQHLIVGDDFHFGKKRKGDIHFLKQFAEQFDLTVIESVKFNHQRISSTRIRKLLNQGNLALAKQLLGKSFFLYGRVIHGEHRGRTLGFPTANINLHRRISPLLGVYLVKVNIQDKIEPVVISDLDSAVKPRNDRVVTNKKYFYGVANIGYRAMIPKTKDSQIKPLLEVHLFDFNQDIYGQSLIIEFLTKLRDEKKFDSKEQLKHQIEKDIEQAKDLIQLLSHPVACDFVIPRIDRGPRTLYLHPC